jgi:hypothetical protein
MDLLALVVLVPVAAASYAAAAKLLGISVAERLPRSAAAASGAITPGGNAA